MTTNIPGHRPSNNNERFNWAHSRANILSKCLIDSRLIHYESNLQEISFESPANHIRSTTIKFPAWDESYAVLCTRNCSVIVVRMTYGLSKDAKRRMGEIEAKYTANMSPMYQPMWRKFYATASRHYHLLYDEDYKIMILWQMKSTHMKHLL